MSRVCTISELIEVLSNIYEKFGDIDIYDRTCTANNIVDFLKSGNTEKGPCLIMGAKAQAREEVTPQPTTRMLDITSGRSLSTSRA